ncbi:MAG: bifunctional methionine sulfoxide reductase B/A protein [Spirochaetia bacterium]|nr:bifunctional methionine sulfoxide reductase B/A protein [Spirochaetia bacterium]MCF7941888.1 bifunctional methionine sulfoxide reductase B/A protein [Spirochaetia bacterium]
MEERHMRPLSSEEIQVIEHKGTEAPYTGEYWNHFDQGVYVCRRCGAPLYRSDTKFTASCGWPSFDEAIPHAVRQQPDADGIRTEILCEACGGHLGHVFTGEHYTEKNSRHCVNSLSMHFIKTRQALFASGCFWGTQYHFDRTPGVVLTTSGFSGGTRAQPTYEEVCRGTTGHLETVEVLYDPEKTTFEQLAKVFFETHDPTQTNGQGPDIGSQYLSAIFYHNKREKEISEQLISLLTKRGYTIATRLLPAGLFWPASEYHQHYYEKKEGVPYCHFYTRRF